MRKSLSPKALLSFDIEEFDLPREHGHDISVQDGVKVSSVGLKRILEVLDKTNVRATFFVTGNFAKENPAAVLEIKQKGHELACHGVDHFSPAPSDLKESKAILEKVAKTKVSGYRVPRMQPIDYKELSRLDYAYDSSVNPAFIPGRYNHLSIPRKPYKTHGVLEIPTSVATRLRIPLFWLSLHLFPLKVYLKLVKISLKETGFFATYFHPWEFADLGSVVPFYIRKNSGRKLASRLEKLITFLKSENIDFVTFHEFATML